MKTLVISKPIYEYILPLMEFPQDGDKFYVDESIQTISSAGTILAYTLGKIGMDVSFTGMIGNDDSGKKIVEILNTMNVDTKYVEVSYTEKTLTAHKIYNSKSNKFTSIFEKTLKTNLTKYKYEFIPDTIIIDDADYNANLAALNNYPKALTVFIANKYDNVSSIYCKRCNYVICDLLFASNITGVVNGLNKEKNLVLLFQKYIDLYDSNLIIKLNNFDILYCVNDEVRIIKNINNNLTNKDDIFNSILIFNIINGYDIENSIKLTNKIMLSSGNEIDMLKNIPSNDIIRIELENMKKNISLNNQSNQINNSVSNQNNVNITKTNNSVSSIQNNSINNNQGNNLVQNSTNSTVNSVGSMTSQTNPVNNNIAQNNTNTIVINNGG